MQDRNDFLEVLNSKLGTFDDLSKEPMPEGATSRTIGLWPKKGEVVKLRGLDFQVRFSCEKTGELRLSIARAALLLREADNGQAPSNQPDTDDN